MIQIDLSRLPAVKQICEYCCVLACIENVLKYNGDKSYTQNELINKFPLTLGNPYFQKIYENFTKNIPTFKSTRLNIPLIDDYLKTIENNINKDIPIIISAQSGKNSHALITVGYSNYILKFFDSWPNKPNYFQIPKNELRKPVSNHRGICLL